MKITKLIADIYLTLVTDIEGDVGSYLRWIFYKSVIRKCGGYFYSEPGFRIRGYGYVSIGKGCCFGTGVMLVATNSIVIGDCVMVGPYAMMRDANMNYSKKDISIKFQGETTKPIKIGNDVWLGAHVAVLAGSEIGRGSIIGANAVVNKKIPEYEVWCGVPARFIKKRVDSHNISNRGPGRI